MSKTEDAETKARINGITALVGCLLVGLAAGLWQDNAVIGIILGLGIGLVVMALFSSAYDRTTTHR